MWKAYSHEQSAAWTAKLNNYTVIKNAFLNAPDHYNLLLLITII